MSLAREIVRRQRRGAPATFGMVRTRSRSDDWYASTSSHCRYACVPCQFYRRGRTRSPAALTFMEMLRDADAEMATAEKAPNLVRPARRTKAKERG